MLFFQKLLKDSGKMQEVNREKNSLSFPVQYLQGVKWN